MTRVKTCGITNLDDARRAADLGAWALGLIFWPESPRACERRARPRRSRPSCAGAWSWPGVFVNATLDEVAATADRAPLSILQLHGDEGPPTAPRPRAGPAAR